MRLYTVVLFIMAALPVSSQKITTYYDYKWQTCDASKARFFSTFEKTDSGWYRNDYFVNSMQLQMTALYKDSTCKIINGHAVYYYANGLMEAAGKRINNEYEGVYMRWHPNGMLADSANYHNGKFTDTRFLWYANGMMSDSMIKINDSITVNVSWFDNGNPSATGYYIKSKKSGKWNYFHKNGKLAAVEMNENDKVTEVEYFNEDGSPLSDTSLATREGSFKGGLKKWKQYLLDKIYWPSNYKLVNSNTVTVVVSFIINEEGKVEGAYVSTPFNEIFDEIALDVINKSPLWLPTIDHNRKVKQHLRQPLTFLQE